MRNPSLALTLALAAACCQFSRLPAAIAPPTADAHPPGAELLRHPGLVTTNSHGVALAAPWTLWQPEWAPARINAEPTSAGVRFHAPDTPYAVGGLAQTVSGIRPGHAYRITARCDMPGVAHPAAAALVRLEWLQANRPLHPAGHLVDGPHLAGAAGAFEDVLVAPANADGARLSLEVKWPRGGSVLWTAASLLPTQPPSPQRVKVGTVYLRPRDTTPERNLDLWCEQIDAAGRQQLDIVCLSEAILLVGTPASASAVAEPIPGPATRRLGEAARRNRLWIVAGLMEQAGPQLFNTAVLINRNGHLAGTYRKVHLPREEWKKGITPGHDYPVFLTDFGTVGIQVCYDYFFPEPTRILADKGAEIVFAPTWGTTFADQEGRAEGQTIFRTRARDNGVWLVPSVYDGDSLIIDPLGRVLASSQGQTGVFSAEIDLSAREPLWWVGHWRSLAPRHRMPETYSHPARSP